MRISPLGLDHLVVRVADLDRSLRFYCDILGVTLTAVGTTWVFIICEPAKRKSIW